MPYRDPARPQVEEAARKLSDHLEKLDNAYGGKEVRRFVSVEDCAIPGAERLCLDDLASGRRRPVR